MSSDSSMMYIVVGGVNGAGKSTIYKSNKGRQKAFETDRINADEILKSRNGDWRSFRDMMKSMVEVGKEIDNHFQENKSFHHETTLDGGSKNHLKRVKLAKEKGYDTTLYYIGLDSPDTAISRVNNRVKNGGHGIDEDVIKKRYGQSLKNLETIESYFDNVSIYDNSGTALVPIYQKRDSVVRINQTQFYNWVPGSIKNKSAEKSIETELLEKISNDNGKFNISKISYPDDFTNDYFKNDETVNSFYESHKNEIGERILKLEMSTGITKDEFLGDNKKKNACKFSFQSALGNIINNISEEKTYSKQNMDRNNNFEIE